ncbi:type II toxin-antitoxin system RelE/ParE family toxin [Mitsuaria sp. 7]|uniref:type II toxin-antitoxin system RelE/ParE family toxin n=1 Tax=Mitsuaria sp. 7 TaxID=1658665 RepID=UPI0007DE296F|nr:type II toxin-antitoxin system RelE/ParE family toxin [Mitsuaria sp. 7]ANH69984.1 hypothetical protein ABE85_24705 [Mitsuaria sp. 7]
MIVRLLREAKADLQSIGDYIARNNPARAESFLAELEAKVESLATMAESFPFARLPNNPDARRRVHGRYGIYYIVDLKAARVDVFRIIHTSRDITRIFNA